MKKSLWNSKNGAEKAVEKSISDLSELTGIIEERSRLSGPNEAAGFVGPSFISQIYELCEALLNAVCWDYVSENGTFPFPRFNDLKKTGFNVPFIIPSDVRYAVDEICSIKKECDKGEINTDIGIIDFLLLCVGRVIKYFSIMASDETSEMFGRTCDHLDNIRRRVSSLNDRAREESRKMAHAFHMIVFRDGVGEEDFTDEQLDEIYRIRTRNSNKHLAIIEIFEILKRRAASPENRIGVKEVQNILEKECGIYLERKAVSRNLVQLEEAGFICRGYEENGYWYDDQIYNDRFSDY